MSKVNTKTRIETLMEVELERYQNGEIRTNVSNQHNEYVLESALETLKEKGEDAVDSWVEWWENSENDVMALAHHLSTFEVEPLDAVWTR